MGGGPLWITEAEVVELMDLVDAVAALEAALRKEAEGTAQNMTKSLLQFADSNLHAIGGKLGNTVGTKSWAHTPGGTCPLLLLWSAEDGSLIAVIEAFALGSLRTGGISGVAAKWMAQEDASVMAIAGTGKQALAQVGAMLAVRPIGRLKIFSPRAESRRAFAEKVTHEFGIGVQACPTIEEACRDAQIVTLVTRARSPFLSSKMLARAAHLNAVGAIALDREEFSQDVFARASVVAVDSLPGVQQLSKEYITQFGPNGWNRVSTLSSLIEAKRRRAETDDLSIFKAMGMGISDLALGVEIVDRARKRGAGRVLPQPRKRKPRLSRAPARGAV